MHTLMLAALRAAIWAQAGGKAAPAPASGSGGGGGGPIDWILPAVLIGAVLFGIGFLFFITFKALYKRTGADLAFVRTGAGRAKVIVDGGAFVIGFLHTIKWINLETMRLQVVRQGKDALITKDKFRVDIAVEFYIRVEAMTDNILKAARSLGDKGDKSDPRQQEGGVKQLIEAKLVGALRAVAATKNMIELHTERQKFEDAVQETLRQDLEKNGLTLESVSIVHLDQTDKAALDPNNVFDAEGLKLITDATEKARREKNEIQRNAERAIKDKDVETDIAVKMKVAENEVRVKQIAMEGEKKKLDAEKELQFAAAQQLREVEVFKAGRVAEAQQFKYQQEQATKQTEIEKEQVVAEREIAKERGIKERDLEKETILVAKRREMQEAQIAAELAVERARRDKEIGIIQKIQEQEAAEAEKLAIVADREKANQNVLTVQKTAEAERSRQVAIIEQRAISEQQQIEKQVHADAVAYEIKRKAQADAEAAEQQAAAIERLAQAHLAEAEARAAGERKMFEAKNSISVNVLLQETALKLIDRSPEMIRELMKPAEKISDIKILNVTGTGLNGGGGGANGHDGAGGGASSSIVGKVVVSLLQAGAVYPLFKELLRFANEKTSVAELASQAVDAVKSAGAGLAGAATAAVAGGPAVEPAATPATAHAVEPVRPKAKPPRG